MSDDTANTLRPYLLTDEEARTVFVALYQLIGQTVATGLATPGLVAAAEALRDRFPCPEELA